MSVCASCGTPGPRECCGIAGLYGVENAAELAYLGLYSLQHRGQESAGIVAADGRSIQSKKGLGLLAEAIAPEELADLPGHVAVGHVRYSTTGSGRVQNIQPLVIEYSQGIVAVAHNGNLTNARELRDAYEARGSIFQTSTDSEIFVHLMADPDNVGADEPLAGALQQVRGAYSLLILGHDSLVAVRDPYGFRPLCLGRLGAGWVVASETCALDLLGAEFVRDVEPGEIVRIDPAGLRSVRFSQQQRRAHCVFEYIYFARPDSVVFGEVVHEVRLRLGAKLAEDAPAEADCVIPIPDSGNSAALGYSRRSGIPLDMGFVRNHYIGRTFISPAADARVNSVRIKLNVIRDVVRGRRLVVVDDSIVRGTTCRARVASLKEAGAREVHLRISAPPIRHPCYYGIDFQHADELIAAEHSVGEIAEFIGVDSLAYQTVEGLVRALPGPAEDYCLACFEGDYPVAAEEGMDKHALESRRR
ncbi:MAG: amidophosphoribosyltransferase [Candidatus Brocadiia bacterium]